VFFAAQKHFIEGLAAGGMGWLGMAALSLTKVEKTYPNGFRRCTASDLEVRDGEFMVLSGPERVRRARCCAWSRAREHHGWRASHRRIAW
jgi:hypothetical protein